MSTNRLFIYDPETRHATCLAKGYSETGWVMQNVDATQEFLADLGHDDAFFAVGQNTRLQLHSEGSLPQEAIFPPSTGKAP
jgi:hypothetical protein